MGENLVLAVRASTGLHVRRGLDEEFVELFTEKACRVATFSEDGRYLAYCDTTRMVVVETATWKPIIAEEKLGRVQSFQFSPKSTLLLAWEPYAFYGMPSATEKKEPEPNLHVFRLSDGKQLTTLIAPKHANWKPEFSDDEATFVRLFGSEILVHERNVFDKCAAKHVVKQAEGIALNRGAAPHHLGVYIPASKGQPAIVQLRRLDSELTTVASKTFFKADSATLHWNNKGSAMLVQTIVDVDKTNKSYYGEQAVYVIATNGDSFQVPLGKKGPVYAAKWSPTSRSFVVCYGFMPAKVTLYNVSGDVIHDWPESGRNDVHWNRFGNILLICGFGNLAAGKMEMWDMEKRALINSIEVPSTTQFAWAPDGQHFATATTTPRLRTDNNYRLWDYTGRMLSEFKYEGTELWEVSWRPHDAYQPFKAVEVTGAMKKRTGLPMKLADESHPLHNLPAGAVTKAGAYVPPHLRNKLPPGAKAPPNSNSGGASLKLVVSDSEKKLRAAQKKLDEIAKLKQRIADGENLETNQRQKVDKEAELVEQIEKLKLEAAAAEKARQQKSSVGGPRGSSGCRRDEDGDGTLGIAMNCARVMMRSDCSAPSFKRRTKLFDLVTIIIIISHKAHIVGIAWPESSAAFIFATRLFIEKP